MIAELSLLLSSLASAAQKSPEQRPWTILAEEIHTAAGGPVGRGSVVVGGSTISYVGPGGSDDDRREGDVLRCFAVTPGLIDASARIDAGPASIEQSREVAPDLAVAATLDPFAVEWDRQLRSGVTTVLVTPPDYAVIGGVGVVLKTGGPESIEQRTLEPRAVLRGAMGSQPSAANHPAFGRPTDFFSRRPTTRMGVEWEWRKAFYDAAASRRDPERAFRGSDRLLEVLDGKLTLAIQAWTTQDIRTAVFLKEEIEREGLGKPRVVIDAAAEAWKEPQLLVRSKVSVVLPPFPPGGRTGEGSFLAWNAAKVLDDLGVPVALSSHGGAGLEERLPQQAGYAMAGGLAFDRALAAVTINPARMLGVEERVGSLEVGKDADLVLWSGPPFEPASRVIGVVLGGALVVDPREEKRGS